MEINRCYNENCLETMNKIPDGYIDLTVTSPPYDNLRTYNGYSFNFEAVAKELFRITKQGGVVVWVVSDATIKGSETGTSFKQALYFKEVGFNLHDTMIYQTNKPPQNNRRYEQDFEYMFIFSKYIPSVFNGILVDSLHPGVRHTGGHRKTTGELTVHTRKQDRTSALKLKGNIWYLPRSSKSGDVYSRMHPATFPDQLAEDHILSWSNEVDLVYDPFMGSGTTAKMAILNKRNWIGSEISEEYCQIIERRITTASTTQAPEGKGEKE